MFNSKPPNPLENSPRIPVNLFSDDISPNPLNEYSG